MEGSVAGLNLVVTGKLGVGKTTLAERVVEELRGSLRMCGFTPTEVRDSAGQRLGFDLVTVGGEKGELARLGLRSPARVGRYGVNLVAFERLALPELACRDVDLMVVDEIGKMECASSSFRRAVEAALDAPVSVLATIGIGRLPFFQAIRDRPDHELVTLTERKPRQAGCRTVRTPACSVTALRFGLSRLCPRHVRRRRLSPDPKFKD